MNHDLLCPIGYNSKTNPNCECDWIAAIRADEREQAAKQEITIAFTCPNCSFEYEHKTEITVFGGEQE